MTVILSELSLTGMIGKLLATYSALNEELCLQPAKHKTRTAKRIDFLMVHIIYGAKIMLFFDMRK
jgi:hypothetical protein